MTISRLVKVAGAVAVLGLAGQVQAHDGEIHADSAAMVTLDAADPLASLSKNVAAGKISGGLGVNYVGRFVYDNAMAKVDMTKSKMGTELAVVNAPDGFPGFGGDTTPAEAIAITPTKSMGWNDTASNPDVKGATDIAKDGFGWGHNSRWYLVDLSKLSTGKYYVSVKVERYNDGTKDEFTPAVAEVPAVAAVVDDKGNVITPAKAAVPAVPEKALPNDDDLVPALTVWDGYQNRGSHLHWFPNKFQKTTTPFWAEMLKPESALIGLGGDKGFDTAYARTTGDMDKTAQVQGTITLGAVGSSVAKTNRYLTIALGGDDRNPAAKHDVNYKLTVKVHSCVGAPCGK